MAIEFKATSKAANAPQVEPGIYPARFDGVAQKLITGGQYGDGDRFEWAFTLLEDGAVLYDRGEPIQITSLTSLSVNTASKTTPKAVRYLKALMTPAEFAEFSAGNGVSADALLGREVLAEVIIKESGWPSVANIMPSRKAAKGQKASPPVIDEE